MYVFWTNLTILRLTNLVFVYKYFFGGMVLDKIYQYQTNQSTIQKPSVLKKKPSETFLGPAILCDLLSSTEGAKRSPKHCQTWYWNTRNKNVTNLPYYGLCPINAYIWLTVGNTGGLDNGHAFFLYALLFKVTWISMWTSCRLEINFRKGSKTVFFCLTLNDQDFPSVHSNSICFYHENYHTYSIFREHFTLYNEHLTPTAYIPSA